MPHRCEGLAADGVAVNVAVLPGRVEADAVQHVLCKPLRHLVVVLRVGLEGD